MGRREIVSTSSVPLRKGPWMAEEDEVLIEHVQRYGPRDWSSIRSKGLLPRSGKSCRLRWVNKLKPDLKTGCKFTAEEERIVIELQGQFGNKWARIATYLPGRTDNDVKNFWSTRQKRLTRLLKAQCGASSEDMRERSHSLCDEQHMSFEENSQALIPSEEQYQAYLQIHPHTQRSIPPPDLQTFTFGSTFPPSDPWSSYAVERKPFFPTDPSHHFSCLQLPHALLDLPLIPDTHHLATDFDGVDFDPVALSQNVPEFDLSVDRLPPETGGAVGSIPPPADGFFGDFPLEMLDGLDQPPSSSPP